MNQYYAYIMASYRGTLYTGVTSDLARRVYGHRHKQVDGFTKRYNVSKLVYYELTEDIRSAIAREKQIKGWLRKKKVALVESLNPYWVDLAEEWNQTPATTPDPSLRSG
ncbi:MAG: GIY-YIG nuclease family protein [Dehalococcoidia bacterium]